MLNQEFLFLPVTYFTTRMQLTPLEFIKPEIFALFTPVIKVLLVVVKLGFLSGPQSMNSFRSDVCVESAPSNFHFSLLGPQGRRHRVFPLQKREMESPELFCITQIQSLYQVLLQEFTQRAGAQARAQLRTVWKKRCSKVSDTNCSIMTVTPFALLQPGKKKEVLQPLAGHKLYQSSYREFQLMDFSTHQFRALGNTLKISGKPVI